MDFIGDRNGTIHSSKPRNDFLCVAVEVFEAEIENAVNVDESDIVQRIRHILSSATQDDLRQIQQLVALNALDIELVDVRQGSVRLYFWCHSPRAINILIEIFKSGLLQTAIENALTALLVIYFSYSTQMNNRLSIRLDRRRKQSPTSPFGEDIEQRQPLCWPSLFNAKRS